MKYEDALKAIEGAQSAGGELIVVRNGVHIVVGKHVQGQLIVADTDEARSVAEAAGIKVEADSEGHTVQEPEGTTHHVEHHDKVDVEDEHTSGKPKK